MLDGSAVVTLVIPESDTHNKRLAAGQPDRALPVCSDRVCVQLT
jgi:hypothetical protein